jgi:hypothetical protein
MARLLTPQMNSIVIIFLKHSSGLTSHSCKAGYKGLSWAF